MDHLAVTVGEGVGHNHDKVYQRPYTTAAQCEELDDAGHGVAGVEAVYAQPSQEDAEQQGGKPALIGGVDRALWLRHRLAHSTLGTYLGLDVDDLTTGVAILLLFAFHNVSYILVSTIY